MSAASLQIRTDSAFGSGDTIWIKFKEAGSSGDGARGFTVSLLDPPRYRVSHCTAVEEFDKPNVGIPKRWTVTYTDKYLELYCEYVLVGCEILKKLLGNYWEIIEKLLRNY